VEVSQQIHQQIDGLLGAALVMGQLGAQEVQVKRHHVAFLLGVEVGVGLVEMLVRKERADSGEKLLSLVEPLEPHERCHHIILHRQCRFRRQIPHIADLLLLM